MVSSKARQCSQRRIRVAAREERLREEEHARVIAKKARETASRKKRRDKVRARFYSALQAASSIPAPDVSATLLERGAAAHAKVVAE